MMVHSMKLRGFVCLLTLLLIAACQPRPQAASSLVFVVADGREITYQIADALTVEQLLSQAGIEVNNTDRLTPPRFTQVTDGLRITIVRVTENRECEIEEIPYQQEVVLNEGLAPGEQRIAQVGQNGQQEVCYRTIFEDGQSRERNRTGQPTILRAPVDEILVVGLDRQIEPVPVTGTLSYINNNNAWVIQGNSTAKRPLTTSGSLDSHVMALSPDGQYLLYTQKSVDESFVNELWLIRTSGDQGSVKLVPTDVLYAEWVPQQDNTISYSTAEVQDLFPFWRALNNVWMMRIDSTTGDSLNIRQIVQESGGGLSGWWGTMFRWDPSGQVLAWARADSSGIVDENGDFVALVEYAPFRTSQNWSWRSNISWSSDGSLIATTIHGAPVGNEPADTSPIFDAAVVARDGRFSAQMATGAGMWTSPKFSPIVQVADSAFEQGYMAYLQSRDPYNSITGEYDLIVADRDGSNARRIFPPAGQIGLTDRDFGVVPQDYDWSPDGRQIAVIYQGNLWIVDVESTVAHQLTFDNQSSHPVWSN